MRLGERFGSRYSLYIGGLPVFLAMAIASFLVWHFQAFLLSPALFLGVIAGGLVDLDGGFGGRLRNLAIVLVCFFLSAIWVQLTLDNAWLLAVVMTVSAFVITMLGALDLRFRTIAFGSLLVMLYTLLSFMPNFAWWVNPLMLLCGTVLFAVCSALVHLVFPMRPVQDAMVGSFRRLADYMGVKAGFFDPDEVDFLPDREVRLALKNAAVIEAFNRCRQALFIRLSGGRKHPNTVRMLQYYLGASDLHERISSRHVDYAAFVRRFEHSDLVFRIQRLIFLQARACSQMADSIESGENFEVDGTLLRAGEGLREAFLLFLDQNSQIDQKKEGALNFPSVPFLTKMPISACDESLVAYNQLVDNLLAMNDLFVRLENVRFGADLSVDALGKEGQIAGQEIKFGEVFAVLKSHCSRQSVVFRHAVRMALIAWVSCCLVALLDLHFGYWILLTGLLVCQPNYSATKMRLRQRVLGTILGVLVGSALPVFVTSTQGLLGLIVVSSTLFFVFRSARYSFSTFFITIQVLVGFALVGMDTQTAMVSRVTDTLLGSALAWLAVSYLWADWDFISFEKMGIAVLKSDGGYLKAILAQFCDGATNDVHYRLARRIAFEKAAQLSNLVAEMSNEQKKYGQKTETGFELLQLAYGLISSISALGALRKQVDELGQDKDPFLNRFLNISNHLADLMNHADSSPQFAQKLTHAQDTIKTGLNHAKQPVEILLWSQSKRVSERLIAYQNALQKLQNT